jgi:hypothetical protein
VSNDFKSFNLFFLCVFCSAFLPISDRSVVKHSLGSTDLNFYELTVLLSENLQ